MNTSSINTCSSGYVAQVAVIYEANKGSRRRYCKENCDRAHNFITESVVKLVQFSLHGWYIGLFENHQNFLWGVRTLSRLEVQKNEPKEESSFVGSGQLEEAMLHARDQNSEMNRCKDLQM